VANEVSKIERLGLAERVHALMVDEGVTVGREIGRRLRADGVTISDAAVNRYLSKVGRVAASRAEKLIQEHVDRVVPDDLCALEDLESTCLKWSKEDPVELAERMAEAKSAIDFELDEWMELIAAAQEKKERSKVIGLVIKKVLSYILKDARLQDKRIKAMTMAVKIIELKLAKAGMLKDEGRGKIIIVDASEEYERIEGNKKSGDKQPALVVHFGRKEDPSGE
jgi:hypothetical protein